MPKPAHVRVVFEGVIGTLVAPLEHWSFGVNFPSAAIPTDSPDSTVDDLIAESLMVAYSDTWAIHTPTDCALTGVKVSHVNALGHVDKRPDGTYIQGEWAGEVIGMGDPQQVPLQTALCVSLNTVRPGPTGKGRFFAPWPSYEIQAATKRLTDGNTTTLSSVAAQFLDKLAIVMTYAPQVVSSKGYMSEVTSVRVGHVPDTMRSRREDLPEGYVVTPLA